MRYTGCNPSSLALFFFFSWSSLAASLSLVFPCIACMSSLSRPIVVILHQICHGVDPLASPVNPAKGMKK